MIVLGIILLIAGFSAQDLRAVDYRSHSLGRRLGADGHGKDGTRCRRTPPVLLARLPASAGHVKCGRFGCHGVDDVVWMNRSFSYPLPILRGHSTAAFRQQCSRAVIARETSDATTRSVGIIVFTPHPEARLMPARSRRARRPTAGRRTGTPRRPRSIVPGSGARPTVRQAHRGRSRSRLQQSRENRRTEIRAMCGVKPRRKVTNRVSGRAVNDVLAGHEFQKVSVTVAGTAARRA